MGDGETTPPPGELDRTCQRCTGPLTFLTALPRTGEEPRYRIFSCAACNFVEWVADQITGE